MSTTLPVGHDSSSARPAPPTDSDGAAQARDAARAVIYGALSQLLASPSDTPWTLPVVSAAAQRMTDAAHYLPYPFDPSPLAAALAPLDADALTRAANEYGGHFEVGEHGPPLPIRAELAPGVHAASKEEVARFYEHFGYVVTERDVWQPDHLAVLLEFMHFLAFNAATQQTQTAALAFQCGARDFVARHIVAWLPAMAARLATADAHLYLRTLVLAAAAFTTADREWLAQQYSEEQQ